MNEAGKKKKNSPYFQLLVIPACQCQLQNLQEKRGEEKKEGEEKGEEGGNRRWLGERSPLFVFPFCFIDM